VDFSDSIFKTSRTVDRPEMYGASAGDPLAGENACSGPGSHARSRPRMGSPS
jgi:hypothetical protein